MSSRLSLFFFALDFCFSLQTAPSLDLLLPLLLGNFPPLAHCPLRSTGCYRNTSLYWQLAEQEGGNGLDSLCYRSAADLCTTVWISPISFHSLKALVWGERAREIA